jgi:hypothetical protein
VALYDGQGPNKTPALVPLITRVVRLGRHPGRNLIHISYGDALGRDFGSRIRNTLADASFARLFPYAELRSGSTAAHRFSLMGGGEYYAVGYSGPVTGRGAHLLLIDDPIKNAAEAFTMPIGRA